MGAFKLLLAHVAHISMIHGDAIDPPGFRLGGSRHLIVVTDIDIDLGENTRHETRDKCDRQDSSEDFRQISGLY